MKNKKDYTSIADLLTDDSFLAWQLKKDERHEAEWNEWSALDAENAQLVKDAVQVLNVLVDVKEKRLSACQVDASFDRLFKKIVKKENEAVSKML